jgi:glutamine synthetase adenylyltransferase
METYVAEGPLREPLAAHAPLFLERRGDDAAARRLAPRAMAGIARAIASQSAAARYLAGRPELLERLADVAGDIPASLDAPWREADAALAARSRELSTLAPLQPHIDLEQRLDDLRLLRRDETLFAACLDLGGAPFERVSEFLSIVAETCTRLALHAAEHHPAQTPAGLAVVGMGKLAGRELTYHSDLDLVFLYSDQEHDDVGERATRTAQRLISYLSTMTAAGVAYVVDARLRPSGRQGALVSSFGSFRAYQVEKAATWEHLALMRARAIAGDLERGECLLHDVRNTVLAPPRRPRWRDIDAMRARVEQERGDVRALGRSRAARRAVAGHTDHAASVAPTRLGTTRRATLDDTAPHGALDGDHQRGVSAMAAGRHVIAHGTHSIPYHTHWIPYKTGRGGLMDLDFLAAGALLECGPCTALPSIPEMLRAHVRGARVEQLVAHHTALRRLEARARWVADRAIEAVDLRRPDAAWVAELVRPGLGVDALVAETARVRDDVRRAYLAVIEADSIAALEAR